MKASLLKIFVALTAAATVSGCAGAGTTAALPDTAGLAHHGKFSAAAIDPDDMTCKKLTGLMQVRLLQVRDYDERTKSTSVSRTLQSASVSTFGGTKKGIDVDGEHAADLEALRSYNEQLVAKGCKSFDLAKELQARDASLTPRPTVGAAKLPSVSQSQQ